MSSVRFLILDCDSTLSAIEGFDELARMRGPRLHAAVAALTAAVENGESTTEAVFAKRLDIIRPTRAMCAQVASLHAKHGAPGLPAMLEAVRAAGWTPVIVAGGVAQCVEPFAKKLAIGRVEAVELRFKTNGDYAGYDRGALTAQDGGKAQVVRRLRLQNPGCRIVMVGDGAPDLECRAVADRVIGFAGVVERPAVAAGAHAVIRRLDELPALLAALPA